MGSERQAAGATDGRWLRTCVSTSLLSHGTSYTHLAQISRVADDRVEQLSAHSGPWQTGTSHRARVIGFSSVDALIQLSLQPSILEQAFMRVSDVQVGEQVKVRKSLLLTFRS